MTAEEIREVSVSQLVQAVEETGRYSFLIGAGTSKPAPAGIPTASELIARWQQECYDRENPEMDIDEWTESIEEDVSDNEKYGFWFEKRHPARGQRRERVRDLVEDAEPTPYHIVLATLMSNEADKYDDENENYVPHTLTPNFDDLLFDSFYRYLEDRPQLINHQAIAPEFRVTRDRPTIVKLHGDYLYDNLQNTDDETNTLGAELREILDQVVREYGLVVVGYGGHDESIMEPLLDADIEYGIYWCARNPENLSPMVEKLLEKPNTFLVPIKGFESLMSQFATQIDDVELPTHDELVDRAERRAEQLDGALKVREEEATDEEEEEFVEKSSLQSQAVIAGAEGEYQQAVDLTDQIVDIDPSDPHSYSIRGTAKSRLSQNKAAIEDYNQAIDLGLNDSHVFANRGASKLVVGRREAAIKDFNKAIEIDSKDTTAWLCRSEAKISIGEYESAHQDANTARTLSDSPPNSATSLLLYLISAIVLEIDINEQKESYRNICNQEFKTSWNFEPLNSWLENGDLAEDKENEIQSLIEMLREHKK